tara:strand:+ start:213 stop:335 length:123 start_codon:yes stop_codon:yes gene_type:complete
MDQKREESESVSSYADFSEESDNPFVIFFKERKEKLLKAK